MYKRVNYASGAKWENLAGYSRAVKMGNLVEVSGTVAADENGIVIGEGNAYMQTAYILRKIEATLLEAGALLKDVVRTRMFVTDIAKFSEYARAHAEAFSEIKPCTSMVEVKALVAPQYLIEIEATAIIAQ